MAGFLALSSLVLGGTQAVADLPLIIPQMTIKIYNNSGDSNIYPVISFPGGPLNAIDKWMQAFFGTTWANQNTQTYRNGLGTTRVYVNCCDSGQTGIPPGGKVEIKLPLYTPLVNGNIDPTKTNQFMEWWQGININIYNASKSAGKPPDALQVLWTDKDHLTTPQKFPQGGKPHCTNAAPCDLSFYTSSKPGISLGNPTPQDAQQLVEATLGATSLNGKANDKNPNEPLWFFDTKNVDYDVSYVNTAYLPAVMEPVGNNKVGWVGTPARIGTFGQKVRSFLGTIGRGWPRFLIGQKVVPGKIASVLEILAEEVANDPTASNDGKWIAQNCPDPPPIKRLVCGTHFSPYPPNSAPIKALVVAWRNCQQKGDTNPFCTYINDTTKLLRANYDNYRKNYKSNPPGWNCQIKQHPNPHPIDSAHLTDLQILRHLYGWTPFNEYCSADANLVQHTPGYYKPGTDTTPPDFSKYQKVKNEFDHLQYWKDVTNGDYGVFHPYVALIHGPTYIDAPFTYAYSVDDAVGNVQTYGTGIVVAVGGPENLPNPDRYTPEVHVDFAYKSIGNGTTFEKYGKCKNNPDTPVNPNFSSFSVPVGVTDLATNCVFSLQDNKGRIYRLQIGKSYPPARCTTDKPCKNGWGDGLSDHWADWTPVISGDPFARLPVQDSCALNNDPVYGKAIRDQWCQFRFAFQMHLDDARSTIDYHVNMGESIK